MSRPFKLSENRPSGYWLVAKTAEPAKLVTSADAARAEQLERARREVLDAGAVYGPLHPLPPIKR